MKLILNIYDHSEVMHVKFYRGDVSYSGVIALFVYILMTFVRP